MRQRVQLLVAAGLLLVSGCADTTPRRIPNTISTPNRTPPPQDSRVVPPWQLWESEAGRGTPLSEADALDDAGRFEDAVRAYRQIEMKEAPGRLREEAFARRVSTLLKSGQSRFALEEVTNHLKEEGRSSKDISPILALLAGYAYVHLNDVDQALAWLGVTLRKSENRGIVARRASIQTENVVRGIPVEKFDAAYQVWAADSLIAPAFQREKNRRAQGGTPDFSPYAKWFDSATYGAKAATALRESDLGTGQSLPLGAAAMTIGVLLPESGKFAEHASRVRQGVELALQDSGQAGAISLAFADSAGDPTKAEMEYERLAREGAAVVLGPLLAKDAEQVARKSETLKVPIVTFTKRPGVTQLSSVTFRLGATADNQAFELVTYAMKQLNLKRFATVFPQDGGNGEEFSSAFRAAVARAGGELVAESSYVPRNLESQEQAVASISASKAQAVFLPDSIEALSKLLPALKSSPLKNAVLLGPALWDDPVAIRGFGTLVEGAVVATPYFSASQRPPVSQFIERYRQTYGRDPELLAAQGYDAARLAIQGLLNAQSSGGDLREKLIPTLRATDNIDGVTGKLEVQDNREVARRMSVLRLHNGEVIEVMSGGNVTGFIPDEPKEQQEATNKT